MAKRFHFFQSIKKERVLETPEKTGLGRPSSEFTASSDRTKRRKTEDIRSKASVEELSYATQTRVFELQENWMLQKLSRM